MRRLSHARVRFNRPLRLSPAEQPSSPANRHSPPVRTRKLAAMRARSNHGKQRQRICLTTAVKSLVAAAQCPLVDHRQPYCELWLSPPSHLEHLSTQRFFSSSCISPREYRLPYSPAVHSPLFPYPGPFSFAVSTRHTPLRACINLISASLPH